MLDTRHACDQGDKLDSYTWTEYDPREGGVQVLKDSFNNVQITTEFLKVAGGEHGGSWAARVKGEPIKSGMPSSLIYITQQILIIKYRHSLPHFHHILFWTGGTRRSGNGHGRG